MKTRTLVFSAAAAVFAGLLALSSSAFAAPGGGNGPPNGGGTPPPPPVDFGDLIKLYRGANGVPIPTPLGTAIDPETNLEVPAGLCQQPLASVSCPSDCVTPAVDETGVPAEPSVSTVIVDQIACAALSSVETAEETVVSCVGCLQEVDFGRINEARSSETVFNEQLQDVVFNLATSDCSISLDPAGRLITGTVTATDDAVPPVPTEWTSATIDSPLQGLAIYRQLLMTGSIGVPLPEVPAGVDVTLTTAARALGWASDKTGLVDVDLVAYINEIMGLTTATESYLPRLSVDVREEVQGTVQTVTKYFLNYGAYTYNREDNFTALPAPAYIDDPLGDEDMPGWFEYLSFYSLGPPELFEHAKGPILNAVFPDSPFVGFDGSNIGAFAQAADDTRAVIDFMHTWPVPADYATAVPCSAVAAVTYDVSISDVSGLQVPRNIVSGTEGREFTVTVANAGPDPATGTVTLTATLANGEPVSIPGSPWTFTDLAAGQSFAVTESFSVTVTAATTINWEATVEAPYDVYTGNNHVHATSNVTLTGRR